MIDIIKLQLRHKLTLDPTNSYIIVKPDDEYSMTTFPLPENGKGCIAITSDEYIGFTSGIYKFDNALTKVIPIPDEEIISDNLGD